MKKYGKRIVAFALAMVVALGSVCYKPPKAEAFVGSMLANMCLSAYMTMTGISLTPSEKTANAMNSLLDSLIPDFVKDYAKEVGEFTYDMFKSVIEQNTVIQTTGKLQVAHNAAALMGRFTGWLVSKYDLTKDDGTPVDMPSMVLPDDVTLTVTTPPRVNPETGGTIESEVVEVNYVPYWSQIDELIKANCIRYDIDSFPYLFLYLQQSSGSILLRFSDTPFICTYHDNKAVIGTRGNTGRLILRADSYTWVDQEALWDYATTGDDINWIYSADDTKWVALAANHDVIDETGIFPPISTALSSILPGTEYQSLPTVEEGYSMVIDTGVAYTDDESFAESVLVGNATGSLAPTYTIVISPTVGEGTEEDTEDETVGILDWTKKIWQSIQEIPQSIADAVGGIFVPSAEYMVALPETVTATFDNRTGFLTYPVSVLYDFADRLTAGQQDFILEWPTVNEPYSGGQLMAAGQFNVSKYVRDNDFASDIYTIYQWVVGAYLTFLFFGLCRRKYNSVIGDRLGG